MLLSVISVLEIYPATLHTKFLGFSEAADFWLLAGLVLHVHPVAHRLPPAARHLSTGFMVSACFLWSPSWRSGKRSWAARRWIRLPGGIHFQPSEWVKLVLIMAVTRYFVDLVRARPHLARHLQSHGAGRGAYAAGAQAARPRHRPSLTRPFCSPACSWAASIGRRPAFSSVADFSLVGIAFSSSKILKPYQKTRLTSFMNPGADPKGSGYQIRQSLIAVGDGGVFGPGRDQGHADPGRLSAHPLHRLHLRGLCRGTRVYRRRIIVLLLYFLILMRLIQNAQTAADLPGTFLIMGVVAVLIFQIAVNVGMVIGLMPVTGIPLPLMSYGGSSVLFTFLALGIVMNVRMSRFVN